MAYRKTYSRSSKSYRSGKSSFRTGDYVPTWNQSQTDTVSLIFKDLMAKVGVTDVASYFHKLFIPIVICMVIGAAVGGYMAGFPGFIWYGLAGLVAPAALLWFGIVACYCALILGVYFAAWAAIIFAFFFLVGR
jgi:hypothetical protein